MDELRFIGRRDQRKSRPGSGWKDVHQQVRGKAVRNIQREIDMFLHYLSVFIVVGNLPAQRIDENVNRFGERGAALNMMVADQAEEAAL